MWVRAAAKSNQTELPSVTDLHEWQHLQALNSDLSEMRAAINEITTAVNADAPSAVPTDRTQVQQRCRPLPQQVPRTIATETGEVVSIPQLMRVSFNSGTTGDRRNMLQRFVESGDRQVRVVKDAAALNADADIRVGNNVLAVFHIPGETGVIFCVGQVRQLVSSTKAYGKKRQVFMSVAQTDTDALMLCHPWAQIDRTTGDMLFVDEPVEYYRIQAITAATRPAPSLGEGQGEEEDRLIIEGQADEDGEFHSVTVAASALISRSVQVDWAQKALAQPDAVLNMISEAEASTMLMEF